MEDAAENIIACVRESDTDDLDEWLSRHQEQATGDVLTDMVPLQDGERACVAYEPGVNLDISAPLQNAWGEDVRDVLRRRLLQQEIGGVTVPARVGCDPIFNDDPMVGMFTSEVGDPYHMAYTTVCMEPTKFLKIQYQMVWGHRERPGHTFEEWLSMTSEKSIESIMESIEAGDREVPRPFLQLDGRGRLVNWQEGRHRGIAAWRSDVEMMDVYVFANHRGKSGIADHRFRHPPAFPE